MFVIAHGGVGSPRKYDENVERAVEKGVGEDDALGIAVEVVKSLEDDETFNAGKGSRMRLDGSIQMDAAVMCDGEVGSVAAIERVKNPVDISKEVYRSPYVILAGAESTKFSRDLGYEEHDPSTDKRREELREMKKKLQGSGGEEKLKRLREFYEKVDGGDTVGCVVYKDDLFAAAVSTGGTNYCMRGRVGDSPLIGCGFYTGEKGAVVTTGKGEEIIKRMSAKKCYDLLGEKSVQAACEMAVKEYPDKVSFGVIAVTSEGVGSADNRNMAQAVFE